MFERPHKNEVIMELRMLALDLKKAYLKGVKDPDAELEHTLQRLVKITDYVGGPDAMEYVFSGKVKLNEKPRNWLQRRLIKNG